jgi:hypothetical protein
MNLLDNLKITRCSDYTSAGTNEINGTTLDMAGFDGVIFCSTIGTANSGNYMFAEEGSSSPATSDLEGSKVGAGGSDADDLVLEIHKPLKRYIRASIARGASTTAGSIWAIQYKARTAPQTSGDERTKLVSPVAGTP